VFRPGLLALVEQWPATFFLLLLLARFNGITLAKKNWKPVETGCNKEEEKKESFLARSPALKGLACTPASPGQSPLKRAKIKVAPAGA